MKYHLLRAILILACCFCMPAAFSQSLSNLTANPTPVCAGDDLLVGFNRVAIQGASTETVALSDNTGSFTTPAASATNITGAPSVLMNFSIPGSLTPGSGYKLRVSSSAAGVTPVEIPITIMGLISAPTFTTPPPAAICQGATLPDFAATATNSSGITYTVTPTPAAAGISISNTGTLTVPNTYSGSLEVKATAAGCGGPLSVTHTLAITPAVTTPVFNAGLPATRCQSAGTQIYGASVSNGTIVYSVQTPSDPASGVTINTGNGEVSYPNTFSGPVVITATASGTCGSSTSATFAVTVDKAAIAPVFNAGLPVSRCKGAPGTETFTATVPNGLPIVYSISPLTAGTINSGTGEVTFDANFTGNATITAKVTGCQGDLSATYIFEVKPTLLSVTFNAGPSSTICVGSNPITYGVTALFNQGLTFSVSTSPTPGGATIDGNGKVTYNATFVGTATISVSALGCAVTLNSNHVVTVKGNVVTPSFTDGATSTRCAAAGTITYSTVANPNADSVRYTANVTANAGTATIDATTGAVTYSSDFFGTVVITARAFGCDGPKTAQHTVTVNGILGAPAFVVGALTNRCQGAGTGNYEIIAANNQGLSYSMTLDRPSNGTNINPLSGLVTFDGNFAGTAVITATAQGCGGPLSIQRTVTVVGFPVFDSGLTSTRCAGSGFIRYPASSINGTITGYTINPSADPNLAIEAATGRVSYLPDFNGTVIITATAAGCGTDLTSTHTVTVTPRVGDVVFDSGLTTTRCQGAFTVRYKASAPNQNSITYSVNLAAANAGVAVNSNGDVSFPGAFSGTVTITARAFGCGGSQSFANHIVNVTPTVGQPVFDPSLQAIRCQGAAVIKYPVTATTATGVSYSVSSTPPSAVTITPDSGKVTYPASFAGTVAITATATGCNGPLSTVFNVRVTQTVGVPVFDSGATSIRCQRAESAPYAARADSTTGIMYSIVTDPIDLTTTVNPNTGMVTFSSGFSGKATVKASAAGCNGPAVAFHEITVIGTPRFTIGATTARCQGLGTETFLATGRNATAITYGLETTPADLNTSINPASGQISFSADFNGVATVFAQGCPGGDTGRLSVSVNATPHIYTLSDSICSALSPNKTLLSSITGSTFAWALLTPTPSNISVNGSTTGTGAITGPQVINASDISADSVRYRVTTTYTANGKTCSGIDTFTLKVKHRPTITTPNSFEICSGRSTNITLRASDTTSTFNWSSPVNGAVTVNGNANTGTNCPLCNSISQILRDTGVNTGIVQYFANATAGGCQGPNDTITVTVNPNPIITFPRANANFSVCSGTLLGITLLDTPGVGPGSFYWNRIDQAGIFASNSPFGNVIRDSVVNLSATLTPTPIQYIVFDTSGKGCAAVPVQFNVTVNPKPVFQDVDRDICSHDSVDLTLVASTGPGSTFTWTVLSTSPHITGAIAGNGVRINSQLRNSRFDIPGTVRYGVIPISPAPAFCQGNLDTVTINVNPLPRLESVSADTICSNSFFNYQVRSSTGSASTYTYSRTGTTPFITEKFPNDTFSVTQAINDSLSSNYALGIHRAEYRINLRSPAGCLFKDQSVTVTIDPTPDSPGISIAPPANLCRNTLGINLGAARQPDRVERFTWSSNQSISQLRDSTRFALARFNTQGVATASVYSEVVGFTCRSRVSTRSFNVSAGSGSENPNVVFFQNNLVCQGPNIAKYQWGFDRRVNLDSVILEGATYQNLFTGAGSGFDPGANYYWVMATFNDGCVRKAYFNEPSLAAPLTIKRSTAELKLYPNPATQDITIEFSEAGAQPYAIEVYDVAGRRLQSQSVTGVKNRMDVRDYVPGYYTVICIQDGVRMGSARFIKQ